MMSRRCSMLTRQRLAASWLLISQLDSNGIAKANRKVGLGGPDKLPTKHQKRSHSRLRGTRQQTFRHRILLLAMVMLRKGFDMSPLPMRGVIVSMDRAIHVMSIPMMGESA